MGFPINFSRNTHFFSAVFVISHNICNNYFIILVVSPYRNSTTVTPASPSP